MSSMNIFLWKSKKTAANQRFSKKLVSQQLVEFLLVAPFLIIVFGLLTEFAYALNINMTLNQGLRIATSSIYSEIRPGMTADDINAIVQYDLTNFMAANQAPVNSENNLTVNYSTVGYNTFFLATYTYIPAFTLPNIYIHILPEKFEFRTVSVVPAAFLSPNNYTASTSADLDSFWSSSADFTSLDSFDDAKRGALRTSPNCSKGSAEEKKQAQSTLIAYNPKEYNVNGVNKTLYELVGWDGKTAFNDPNILRYYDATDGCIYDYYIDIATFASYAPCPLYVLMAFGGEISNVIISNSASYASLCDLNQEYALASQQCAMKDIISLSSSLSSIGNFDNINIASNPLFASSSNYKVDTLGSFVIAHPTSVSVNVAYTQLGGSLPIDYDFGTKVASP